MSVSRSPGKGPLHRSRNTMIRTRPRLIPAGERPLKVLLTSIIPGSVPSLSPCRARLPAMAPKRARTAAARASASSSSQSAGATTKLTLHGGVPHHPALAGLWRDERLTDYRSLISKSSSGTAPVSFSARRRSTTR